MSRNRLPVLLAALALALLTAALFLPALQGEFVWDDAQYITENRVVRGGLDARTAAWAFTTFHASNWHPLTWLSHLLDVRLFGLRPAGHHATGVALHALNASLLFALLAGLTGARWRSLAVAALFAFHPLRVQSVAWIAERKDVLSGFFWLAALAAYLAYARRPGRGRYLAVAACFVLALLAKPMAVTLPLVLLLLDYWPLGRLRGASPAALPPIAALRPLVLEKLPLLGLSAASAVVTFLAQRGGGAVRSLEQFPLWVRALNAVESYAGYLGKALWPAGLSVTYPHPARDLPLWPALLAAALLTALGAAAYRARARRPYLLAGLCWYAGTLVPVIGLVQVGAQAMADRYTYLPLMGAAVAAVWAAADLARGRRRAGPARTAATLAALVAFSLVTRTTIGFWKDEVTLFSRAVALRPNALAHTNLGVALARRGEVAAAIVNYDAALALRPEDANTWFNLGRAHTRRNAWAEAGQALQRAVQLDPGHAAAWGEFGVALQNLKRFPEAEQAFLTAIRLEPQQTGAYVNLAFLHLGRGDRGAARRVLEALRRVSPAAARDLERYLGPG